MLRDLRALDPLLQGVDEVILAGDCLEARHPNSAALLSELRAYFAAAPCRVHFLAGNHDPEISPDHERMLAEGRIWITHGDIFWDSAAPWSRYANDVRALVTDERRRRKLDPATAPLAELYQAHRAANLRSGAHHDPSDRTWGSRAAHFVRTVFPPTQVLRMVDAWKNSSTLAVEWARRHHPSAQFVIFGHVHFPGVWTVGTPPVTVINTGSFTRPFGHLCVDVTSSHLVVRTIRRDGGVFRAGGTTKQFPLAHPTLHTVSAAP